MQGRGLCNSCAQQVPTIKCKLPAHCIGVGMLQALACAQRLCTHLPSRDHDWATPRPNGALSSFPASLPASVGHIYRLSKHLIVTSIVSTSLVLQLPYTPQLQHDACDLERSAGRAHAKSAQCAGEVRWHNHNLNVLFCLSLWLSFWCIHVVLLIAVNSRPVQLVLETA